MIKALKQWWANRNGPAEIPTPVVDTGNVDVNTIGSILWYIGHINNQQRCEDVEGTVAQILELRNRKWMRKFGKQQLKNLTWKLVEVYNLYKSYDSNWGGL